MYIYHEESQQEGFYQASLCYRGCFSNRSICFVCRKASASCSGAGTEENIQSKLIIPKAQGLKISGTFLDEISHDIPHQNWGEKEWDRDFAYMKAIGDRYGNRDPERLSQVYHLSFGVSDENIRLLYAFGRC